MPTQRSARLPVIVSRSGIPVANPVADNVADPAADPDANPNANPIANSVADPDSHRPRLADADADPCPHRGDRN